MLEYLGRLARERRLGLVLKQAAAVALTGDWATLGDKVRRAFAQALPAPDDAYEAWIARTALTPDDVARIRSEIAAMAAPPRFSVLMPVCDVEESWLRSALDSVLGQLYPHWELCVADDASRKGRVRRVLAEYAAREPRIRVVYRERRGHIATATNSALELATGDFVALLDHDDELAPEALWENARVVRDHPDADMIYSDEDKLTGEPRRVSPFFKPDWSPDLFYSVMYTCHLGVYRTALVRELGGFREGFEGSQDYDLVLRLMERTSRIHHIPKVLYHWRITGRSTSTYARVKSYTEEASARALREHFARRGIDADIEPGPIPNTFRARYRSKERPLVSILVPTRDAAGLLKRCLDGLLAKTSYPSVEIVVVDNRNADPTARRYLAGLERDGVARVVRYDRPFNFAALNNLAARSASGPLLLFLNDDTEVVEAEWLDALVEHAVRPEVGAVGARLLYPDGRVQHAGVILGLGGVADHAHKHIPGDEVGYYARAKIIGNFSAVTAACMMVRREVFDEVGGFDERLAVAFNDVDLCLRIRERGYRIVYTPYAELIHQESLSRGHEDTPDKRRRLAEEIELLRQRWGALLDDDPYYSPHLTRDRLDWTVRTA